MPLRVAIVGSGVIGLACARALVRAGASATVVDGGAHGREASIAAAGILGPGSESEKDTPLFRLSLEALREWPETVAALERESRRAIDLRSEGSLLVGFDDGDVAALDARGRVHRGAGLASRLLTGDEVRRLEPRISPRVVAALHVPERRIDNAALHAAYEEACRALGVVYRSGAQATRVVDAGGRVAGLLVGDETIEADAVVIAAGAWSDALAATTGVQLPNRPIKGQLVRVEAPDGFLSHVVKRGIAYAVPHTGRGIVLGTTAEDVGFDRGLSTAVEAGVRRAAEELVVGLGSRPVLETWIGFRPRLSDLLPAIGPVASRPGLFLATGHYRNGILLAEKTGTLVARAVLGDVDPRLAAFSPDRFGDGARVPHP